MMGFFLSYPDTYCKRCGRRNMFESQLWQHIKDEHWDELTDVQKRWVKKQIFWQSTMPTVFIMLCAMAILALFVGTVVMNFVGPIQ